MSRCRSIFLAAAFVAALITTCFVAIPTKAWADSTTPIVQLSPSGGTVPAGSQFTLSWIPANVPLTSDQSLLAYELCYGSGSGAVNSAQAIQIPSGAPQSSFSAPNQVGIVSDIYFRAIYGTTGSTPSIAPCAAMVLLPSAAHLTFTTVAASSATNSTNPALPADVPAPTVSRDPADGHLELGHRLKISWTPVPSSIDNGSLENTGYFVCWGDFALHGSRQNITDVALSPGHTSARLTIFEPFGTRQDVYVYAMYSPPGTSGTYQCRQLPKVAPANIGHTTYVVDFPPSYKPAHLGGCRSGTFSWTPNSIGTGGRGWGYFGNTDVLVHVSATFYSADIEFLYDVFPTGADVKTNLRTFHLSPGKNWFTGGIEPPNAWLEDSERILSFSVSYANCGARPQGFHFFNVINAPAFQPTASCKTKSVQFNWTSPLKKSFVYTTDPFNVHTTNPFNFVLGSWSPLRPNSPYRSQFWSADQLIGYTWREVLIQGSAGESMIAWSPPNSDGNGAAVGGNDWVKHVFLKVSNCPPNSRDWVNVSGPKYWYASRVDFWVVPAHR